MAAFMIAAAHKSSGKTVISTGLSFALSAPDCRVQCFKKGPDYIDPMWLSAASGAPCYNLDFNAMERRELVDLFASRSKGAGISLVEANKGLYDGVDLAGSDSNAQMAKLLELPVVLVIDTNGITRGIAPLLLGYQGFDKEVNIAGVILNKVGGARHEAKLIAAVKEYTDIDVLGAVGRNSGLDIGERHLGLTTPGETGALHETIARFGEIVGAGVDLEKLRGVAGACGFSEASEKTVFSRKTDVRIGVVRDKAFGFYYADDLEAFGAAGAEIVEIDAINDRHLPQLDGLFIGGGFPEMAAAELAANVDLRARLKSAIQGGLPTYAECGGLMYLCKSLDFENQTYPMVGVIDAEAVMHKRPQGRGYVSFSDNNLH
ncbi:MAG TPA: cobyrinate a,c-diamide synthase, partial [Devosia sp.]|nr:cobyrinate a,c-diamide synthase [Devosia sp.]